MPFKPALFTRREVWWPTWFGALVLLLSLALVVMLTGRHAAHFLAPDAPARGRDGQPARTLIVEGWMDEPGLAQALAAFRAGGYERAVSTGGPIPPAQDGGRWRTYAARAADYLQRHGVAPERIVAVPAPPTLQERTWGNAVQVRDWAVASGTALPAVDVFTANVHARRSRLLYGMALGEATVVGVRAAAAPEFDAAHWWRSSAGTKAVLGEGLAWGWTVCCFWPAR